MSMHFKACLHITFAGHRSLSLKQKLHRGVNVFAKKWSKYLADQAAGLKSKNRLL